MTSGSKWGLAAIIGGGVLAGVGVLVYVKYRRADPMKGVDLIESFTGKNGAKATLYFDKKDLPLDKRISILQGLVYKGVTQDVHDLRPLALAITKHCPARDDRCELKAIYDWTKQNIRYTGDVGPVKFPDGRVEPIDFFTSAKRTIREMGGGDCDDHFVVNATLGALNGFEMEGRVTATSYFGDEWSHIYAMAKPRYGGKEVALDTTLPDGDLGVEAPSAKRRDFPA